MSAKSQSRPPYIPLDQLLSKRPVGAGRVFAKARTQRLLTRDERVLVSEAFRSEISGPVEDTTPLIRRDRDER